MFKPTLVAAGAFLAVAAVPASAQGRIDRSFDSSPKSCADVRWSDSVLRRFPGISDNCQNVQTRDGKAYVMLEGEVREVIDDGARLRIDFDGGTVMTVSPPANTSFYIDGEKIPVDELRRGTDLNIYIPEDRFQAEFAGASPSLPLIVVPIVDTQPTRTSASQNRPSQSAPDSRTQGGAGPVMLILVPTAQQRAAQQAMQSGCWTTLYAQDDFKGDSLTLVGPVDLKRMVGPYGLDWDQKLRSIKTGPRTWARIFDNEAYQDRSAKLQPNASIPDIDGKLGLFEEVQSMLVSCTPPK